MNGPKSIVTIIILRKTRTGTTFRLFVVNRSLTGFVLLKDICFTQIQLLTFYTYEYDPLPLFVTIKGISLVWSHKIKDVHQIKTCNEETSVLQETDSIISSRKSNFIWRLRQNR